MTPTFETSQDIINEREAIDKWLPPNRGYTAVKLGKYDLDFKIIDISGNIVAYAEVKCFNKLPDKYPSVILSLNKLNKLQSTGKLNTYFIIKYCDGTIRYIGVADIVGEEGIIKRKAQREGNANDTERCLYISNNLFKTLNR